MRYMILLIGVVFFIFSCKKEKLEGDKAIFIGTWNWIYSSHSYGICDGDNFFETLTPESEDKKFSLEFYEKGIVKFLEDEKVLKSYRIIFSNFGENCGGEYSEYISFDIHLNNKDSDSFYIYGCVSPSEIVFTKGFPYMMIDVNCEIYTNHFIKV
jgi:cbb3-type cytochrome oxidase subunit 3